LDTDGKSLILPSLPFLLVSAVHQEAFDKANDINNKFSVNHGALAKWCGIQSSAC